MNFGDVDRIRHVAANSVDVTGIQGSRFQNRAARRRSPSASGQAFSDGVFGPLAAPTFNEHIVTARTPGNRALTNKVSNSCVSVTTQPLTPSFDSTRLARIQHHVGFAKAMCAGTGPAEI